MEIHVQWFSFPINFNLSVATQPSAEWIIPPGRQEGFAGFAIQNGVARFRPLLWKEVLLRVLSSVFKKQAREYCTILYIRYFAICLYLSIYLLYIPCVYIMYLNINTIIISRYIHTYNIYTYIYMNYVFIHFLFTCNWHIYTYINMYIYIFLFFIYIYTYIYLWTISYIYIYIHIYILSNVM